jgi:hypothetical protein
MDASYLPEGVYSHVSWQGKGKGGRAPQGKGSGGKGNSKDLLHKQEYWLVILGDPDEAQVFLHMLISSCEENLGLDMRRSRASAMTDANACPVYPEAWEARDDEKERKRWARKEQQRTQSPSERGRSAQVSPQTSGRAPPRKVWKRATTATSSSSSSEDSSSVHRSRSPRNSRPARETTAQRRTSKVPTPQPEPTPTAPKEEPAEPSNQPPATSSSSTAKPHQTQAEPEETQPKTETETKTEHPTEDAAEPSSSSAAAPVYCNPLATEEQELLKGQDLNELDLEWIRFTAAAERSLELLAGAKA